MRADPTRADTPAHDLPAGDRAALPVPRGRVGLHRSAAAPPTPDRTLVTAREPPKLLDLRDAMARAVDGDDPVVVLTSTRFTGSKACADP